MLYTGLNCKKSKSAHQQELKHLVDAIVEQKPLQESFFCELLHPIIQGIPQDLFLWLQTLRSIAVLAHAISENPELSPYKSGIRDYFQRVMILRSCPKIQLVEAYRCYIDSLLSADTTSVRPLLEGGAALFEPEGYYSWAQTPMGRFHAELGILWLLMGQRENRRDLLDAAIQIGCWELDASKCNYSPFTGLFCLEADYDSHDLFVGRYLLFSLLYEHTRDDKFLPAAARSRELLEGGVIHDPFYYFLSKRQSPLKEDCEHNQKSGLFRLPSTDLCGWCDPELSLFFTSRGGGSGLGGFSYKSIEILTYAPHQYPLNEVQGFGINTMPRRTLKSQPCAASEKRELSLKGVSRLSNLDSSEINPPWNRLREGAPQTVWVESEQTLKGNIITIDTKIRHFDAMPELAFTFFAKGSAVRMDDVEAIPNQLRHFVMDVTRLEIIGENCTIRLFHHVDNMPVEQASVEVIPLAGNRAFWGADFLISFLYKQPERQNRWTLELA